MPFVEILLCDRELHLGEKYLIALGHLQLVLRIFDIGRDLRQLVRVAVIERDNCPDKLLERSR